MSLLMCSAQKWVSDAWFWWCYLTLSFHVQTLLLPLHSDIFHRGDAGELTLAYKVVPMPISRIKMRTGFGKFGKALNRNLAFLGQMFVMILWRCLLLGGDRVAESFINSEQEFQSIFLEQWPLCALPWAAFKTPALLVSKPFIWSGSSVSAAAWKLSAGAMFVRASLRC